MSTDMDFSNRTAQPQPSAAPAPRSAGNTTPGNIGQNGGHVGHGGKKGKGINKGEWSRIITVLAVAVVAILIGAVIALIVTSNSNIKDEGKYVDTSKLQAVFLNTGQVYFGHIQSLNSKYFRVTDIYYLQTANGSSSSASSSTSNNITLVKLGCELHEPYDQMIINSSQVTFWENLQDGGQVAKAVATFQQQNPQGQKCSDQSSSASTNSGSSAQSAGSGGSSTPTANSTNP